MLNRVELIGNLGRDAELKYTSGGTAVATLSLATQEKWKDRDGAMQEKTEWHRLVLWGKMAESLSQYLVKGKMIYADGRLETKKWTDRSGNERYTTQVVVGTIKLLGGKSATSNRAAREPGDDDDFGNRSMGEPPQGAPLNDNDIPF